MLSFDITDLTGSIRVIKFLRAEDDQSIINKINVGDHLIINGFVTYSRYDEDIVLEPKDIVVGKNTYARITPRKNALSCIHIPVSPRSML